MLKFCELRSCLFHVQERRPALCEAVSAGAAVLEHRDRGAGGQAGAPAPGATRTSPWWSASLRSRRGREADSVKSGVSLGPD